MVGDRRVGPKGHQGTPGYCTSTATGLIDQDQANDAVLERYRPCAAPASEICA